MMADTGVRRPARGLTARRVETAKPGKHHDGNGLILRVTPSGSRQWVQRIVVHGRRVELGLGSPPVVTLAQARERALENRRLARSGGDPLGARREARAVLTFAEAVEHCLAAKVEGFGNEKHRKQWRTTLDAYALPVLGRKPVGSIGMDDVLRVLQPIWGTKNETASRLRGRIEAVLSWATAAGHREGDNPARWRGNLAEMLPKPTRVARPDNQPALALGDAARWWADLASREGMATQALRFAALATARSGEVRGLTWAELDLDAALWRVPARRMKAGRDHVVPLTFEAVELLRRLPRLDGSPHVFFAPRGGALSDMALSAVMRRMHAADEKRGGPGYRDPRSGRPAVPHGLRSAFRQWAAEQGYDREMAELQLAHRIGSEAERSYQRADMVERRRAMLTAWVAFLAGEAAGAKVVPILGSRG